jgi:hypothetical protein
MIRAIQPNFNPSHRERAVYHTLYSAVCYFDIVLSTVPLPPDDFDLVASVCYWISSKVDTHHEPTVDKINATLGTTFTVPFTKQQKSRF